MEAIMSLFSGQHFWEVIILLLLLNLITIIIISRLLTPKDSKGKKRGKA